MEIECGPGIVGAGREACWKAGAEANCHVALAFVPPNTRSSTEIPLLSYWRNFPYMGIK